MKAIIIGATGLVGRSAMDQLLAHPSIESVLVFVRRSTRVNHPKLNEVIVDFERINDWKNQILGDLLISAMGTTLKTVGSKEAQYRIDHDYQLFVAQAAAQNGVGSYVLVSSVNASSKSPFFYLKMKGELEDKIKKLPFTSITILRPGPLKGHREQPRLMEEVSTSLLSLLPVSAGMKPVEGDKVAEVAVNLGIMKKTGIQIIEAKSILRG